MAKISRIGYFVAFITVGLAVLGALSAPVIVLPLALIPLFAGVGILRRRVWSAYGFALYLLAHSLALAFLFFRAESSTSAVDVIATLALSLLLSCFFLFVGRSLAAEGASRGRAWPWIVLSILTALPLLFVQAFLIPSGAMEDTLLIGDSILVQCFPKPKVARGDMVAFVYPVDRHQRFVKRVIGVAGDHFRISHKFVYRNGIRLSEPYALHKTSFEDSYRDNFPSESNSPLAAAGDEMLRKHVVNGEVVVPEDSYFVLGDNRDNSLDSRYWGFVGSRDLIGKPFLIYDSEDRPDNGTFDENAFRPHHTRWSRLCKRI